ncbi:MAG: hypothetical protein HY814_05345 [Candidatus Riflebacteria bacterium]|nr:hypothetical protein [Candidatus Riflebacteria bacterium]
MLIGVVLQVLRSGSLQEKQVMEFSELQREARKAIELLQRDVRGMQKIEVLRRGAQGQLETLVLLVPTSDQPTQEVQYAFNPAARMLNRNGESILKETVQDVQLWPFDASSPPHELLKAEDFPKVAFFKLRVTLARQQGEPGVGQRAFDFLVYPRMPASVRKTKEGRLNQAGSRFTGSQQQ